MSSTLTPSVGFVSVTSPESTTETIIITPQNVVAPPKERVHKYTVVGACHTLSALVLLIGTTDTGTSLTTLTTAAPAIQSTMLFFLSLSVPACLRASSRSDRGVWARAVVGAAVFQTLLSLALLAGSAIGLSQVCDDDRDCSQLYLILVGALLQLVTSVALAVVGTWEMRRTAPLVRSLPNDFFVDRAKEAHRQERIAAKARARKVAGGSKSKRK
uniref:Uncharacterized protein n=1 Tax=Sexangularia sp. CB-2014 TaxID=1486929 RepID=A0A7S1VHF1_9EUKA